MTTRIRETSSRSHVAGLIRRTAAGETEAMSELYDATSRIVFGLCRRILRDPADAEEATLDVYTQAWRQATRFDPERGDGVTWLLTLAHSRAIDRLRSRPVTRRREATLDEVAELADGGPDPEGSSALAERARAVRRALGDLSPEQRRVIELAYFEGLTHGEIAERLNEPLGTAKSRIRLALEKLRDSLGLHAEGWTT